jgi:peptide subunit release factor 1 (eRF1)
VSARNEITPDTLQRLARVRADGERVLSVYFNLDPERFATPPARASELRSLVDDARRRIESGDRPHDELEQLRADLDRVAEHLRRDRFAEGAHAHAVFCCSALELFETLSLPRPVEPFVTVDSTPFIAPLAEIGPAGRWCVALVNRRVTRVLRGPASNLSEVLSFGDNVHGQHSQGGWSQARYQRSVGRDVEEHLRRTREALLSQYRRRAFSGLLIAAPEELRKTVVDAMHPYVSERIAGFIDVDVETASPDQVRAAAEGVIAEREEALVHAQLERLRAGLGSGGRAAAGAEQVSRCLEERRVETLLITSGAREPALEQAVHAALDQGADVLPVDSPELGPLGGIAAVLRY